MASLLLALVFVVAGVALLAVVVGLVVMGVVAALIGVAVGLFQAARGLGRLVVAGVRDLPRRVRATAPQPGNP